ncbi:MAG: chloride channel protein [Burkholderiales bacterium]|nr:chloride channel protein [Burkholderiales bacterium]
MPLRQALVDVRVLRLSLFAALLAAVTAWVAQGLILLINGVTNLAFYGRWSTDFTSPALHHLGWWVLVVPVVGGVIVGLMARFGSAAIRGHGIPEAMEQILTNDSRIPLRMTFLKPLSSAIAIGSGGPFGAEGPIIATGGAMGSVLGQVLKVTAVERKALLAAGAAAGMAAIFNAPMSAVLLAIELLLFELKPRSLIPVVVAVLVATTLRQMINGALPVFASGPIPFASPASLPAYALIGMVVGLASVGVTRAVYAVEDAFQTLPIHWMWWPAIGGLAVGLIGYAYPDTLGVGYSNIDHIIQGRWGALTLATLMLAKFTSWVIALGSGTSGGTLAPLFTIGGAMGGLLGLLLQMVWPMWHVHPGMAALVGMAAMFGGASRAVLTSVLFVFETTGQASTLLPLMAGCGLAYLVSCLAMRTTIMTEKITRRGIHVPSEYAADYLEQIQVAQACTQPATCLFAQDSVASTRDWFNSSLPQASHQGYPVVDEQGRLLGVVTRRQVQDPKVPNEASLLSLLNRAPLAVTPQHSLRQAADHMVEADVGRLVVVDPVRTDQVLGILTRGDLLKAQLIPLNQARHVMRTMSTNALDRWMGRAKWTRHL